MIRLPSVTIIIVHYKGIKMLQNCLDSVLKTNYSNLNITLVDNGSSDGTIDLINTRYRNAPITTIRNEKNLGFVGGNNIALRKIESDYVVLLNDDTTVEPDWIKLLIKVAEEDQTIAACQPKLLSKKNPRKFDYSGASGGFLDVYGVPFCRGRIFDQIEEDKAQYDKIVEIFWACGAAILIRSKVLSKTGLFDELFFAHMEEIDLCWRMKMLGYKIVCNPLSVVYHISGGTKLENTFFLKHRNNLYCLLKNYSIFSIIKYLPIKLFLDLTAILKFFLENDKEGILIMKSYFSLSSNLKKLIERRYSIQATRKVTDKEITKTMAKNSIIIQHYLLGRKRFNELIKYQD